jgi:hypothetical protein
MAQVVMLIGKSGSGKSTSMRNFSHDELALINVNKKPLPFRGKFDSTVETTQYEVIAKAVNQTQKKAIVIDDAGYLITAQFMNGHGENKGNAVFELYNSLADNFYKLIKFCQEKLSDDKIVYFVMHEDKNEFGETKPKTIGKMLDEKVCVEGLFTIVLRAECKEGKYIFHTKTDGLDVTKSPMGMFEEEEIDNDLKKVDTIIRDYYDLAPLKKGDK